MPVRTQCELLGLSRSSVYYRPRGVGEGDLLLMRRIDELHLEHPFLGARKLSRLLKDEGYAVGRRHVGTLMRRMGIEPIYRKPRTSLADKAHRVGTSASTTPADRTRRLTNAHPMRCTSNPTRSGWRLDENPGGPCTVVC
jgi:transposase InsO family protein